jgi:UDP-N-acetylglucosamine:LPS N-acetylglucosamine transferase
MLDQTPLLTEYAPPGASAPSLRPGVPLRTVDLIYFNAGGGHRMSALALEAAIREQRRPWQVRLVNLTEVLDAKDVFRRVTGVAPEHLYNVRLQRGWTLGLAQELKLLQRMIRLGHAPMLRLLREHWRRTAPDLVVSLVPNFNRVLYDSVVSSLPGVPYVTVMTDLADYPPNFWIEPGQEQHIVCGTPRAAQQAAAMGYPAERIHLTSGMIIRPEFYRPPLADRDAERRRLGLDPSRPTGVVMFGGHGSRMMLDIERQLHDTQLILICGHNARLARRLRLAAASAPRLVLEFTADVVHYLQLGDFFIGKPGPASLSESVRLGLPVVTVRNAWTMPQERYNTQWVRDNGFGTVHDSFRDIRAVVVELVGRLHEYQRNLRLCSNRAVFEVPEILVRILSNATTPCDRGAGDDAQSPRSIRPT